MKISKLVIYAIVFIITLYSMEGLNINSLFKKGRIFQARVIYMLIAMSISYLVTSFIYDFINVY